MKIFSNFNTNYSTEILNENLKIYKKEEVVLLLRSKFYLYFHVIPLFLLHLLILLWIFYMWLFFSFGIYIFIIIFLIWFLVFWFNVVYKLLKYICDFTVITPWWITTYKQKWVIHSVFKEIPSGKIKVVEIFRSGILGNIFCYGSVDIIADISDGNYIDVDNESPWVLGLSYVDSPWLIKSKISKICYGK